MARNKQPKPLETTIANATRERILLAYARKFDGDEDSALILADMARSYDGMSYVVGDTHHTAFNEGQRHAYRALLAMIEEARNGSGTERSAELVEPNTTGGD